MNQPIDDSNWKKELAQQLKRARGDESRAHLGSRCNISERTIWLIEQEKIAHVPREETIVRLALATGGNPDEWLQFLPGGAAGRSRMSDADVQRVGETIRSRSGTPAAADQNEKMLELIQKVEELTRRVEAQEKLLTQRLPIVDRPAQWKYVQK
jgi:hypothetical protein